ncbi:imelysin family protein [Salinarimonas ramus]|uniref:Peptidase n=1 Tax=Salinarimonas ramus TaxID=690164 RepID=A0A917V8N0_9HYPH|nr:imelysin family protein [Salinarimonas ramus]GGK50662.1 peptidase [Salinarimonas ramus]
MRRLSRARTVLTTTALAGLLATAPAFTAQAQADAPAAEAVVETYSDIAHAMYEDALASARDLSAAVDALLADPSAETLASAREAWLASRVPYQQTEGLRFGNAIVDEWEGRVNAWPLDEGLIDYVATDSYGEDSDENPLYTANVIANETIQVGRETIDASTIDADLLRALHEADGVEANVSTGYHAIEFLLWGQDLNGTDAGAGERPASDFATGEACTNGACERRRAYLEAATDLLISDLEEMVAAWADEGEARADIVAKGAEGGLSAILTGLGSLSYGELAGERMKLGVLLHDPEEEHDCFSDNTHNSHYYNQVGMQALYGGRYERIDGSVVEGPSLADYAQAQAPEAAGAVATAMEEAHARLAAMKERADTGVEAYDQMLALGNSEGNAVVEAGVEGLVAQARALETLVADLGLTVSVEGSDSLDDPSAVQ